MAKQTGIHQIKGRVGEMSYYRQKGVSNGLLRSINPGMSERVKSSAEYANTRLNASEFGSAGSMAGATLRSVSKKWRYILDPFATGKLGRDVLALIKQDSTNPWGERVLTGTGWQDKIREKAQGYVKNPYNEFFDLDTLIINRPDPEVEDMTDLSVRFTLTVESLLKIKSLGAEGVLVEAYQQSVTPAAYDDASGKYIAAQSSFKYIGNVDIEIGETGFKTINAGLDEWPVDSNTLMSNVIIVVLPYKVVGNVNYTLQNLCTCLFAKLPEAAL